MEPDWLKIARAEQELHPIEQPGSQANNARILDYHASVSLHALTDEVPWCSAFVNWCLEQAGIRGTGRANARSWLSWGRLLEVPLLGAVTVFSRGSDIHQGHVAFYIGEEPNYLFVLGGNQSDTVCVKPYTKANLLGYRWPKVSDYRVKRSNT